MCLEYHKALRRLLQVSSDRSSLVHVVCLVLNESFAMAKKADPDFRSFNIKDARHFGVCEATIIQQIIFWSGLCSRDPSEGIYRTIEVWLKDLPYNRSKFLRATSCLKKSGVLKISQGENTRHNHTVWYALNMDKLEEIRSGIPTVLLNVKDKQKMTKCTFNHSIEASNLYRISQLVVAKENYNLEDNNDLVVSKCTDVVSKENYKEDALIIYIQRHLQKVISENLKDGQLDYLAILKIHEHFTFRTKPQREYFRSMVAQWSQRKRDRFIPRFADHLLFMLLNHDTNCCDRDLLMDLKVNKSLFTCGLTKTGTDFVSTWLNPTPPHEEKYYDRLLTSKLKSYAGHGKPRSKSKNVISLSIHEQFKAKKQQAGYDPLVGS